MCTKFYSENLKEETSSKTRCTWEDNIKMDLKEIERKGVDGIHVGRDRVQWQVFMNTV
jgi:hypothetical protein